MAKLEKWKWQKEDLEPINKVFHSICKKFPNSIAQIYNESLYGGKGELTWSEMKEIVDNIACGLMSLDLKKQGHISLMSKSSPVWTQVDMAVASVGAVSVTIYPTLSNNEVSYIVNDSKSSMIFLGDKELLLKIKSSLKKMPLLKYIIVMDLEYKGDGKKVFGLSQLSEIGKEYKDKNLSKYTRRNDSVKLDDVFTILYTSGTTGQGKGVVLTHRMAAGRMSGTSEFFERYNMKITEKDVGLCFLPLSHIFDRGSMELLAIYKGATIAYADSPGTLLEDMRKYNPTWINCVPRLYEKIYITFQQQMSESPVKEKLFNWALKVGEKALEYRKDKFGAYNMHPDFDLKSKLPFFLKMKFSIADKLFAKIRALFGTNFKFSFSASAGISPDLLEFYYIVGLSVVEGYGSTESFNACILNPIDACLPGYIGINANGSWTRVAKDGELEISGAGIFKKYLNKRKETTESFTKDGWFKTGDLVIQNEQGYYKIVDRKKAIICTAVGKNIAPAKLENFFSTSKIVEQTFFIGDERNFITALIVPSYSYFLELFDKGKISYDKDKIKWSDVSGAKLCMSVGEELVLQKIVQDAVQKEVDAVNEKLEKFERIKKFVILKERFSEENGQLTPTQKTKKNVLLKTYAKEIDEMYK